MSTPHNQAEMGDFAKTCLLPGDPLRAKFIAENFLENVKQVNSVRNMLGFTGTYKGVPVSVMGSGMGCASIGIYSYELFNFYGVENLIRVGSTGAYLEDIKLGDIVMAQGACTDGNFAHQYGLPGTFSAIASYDLLSRAVKAAEDHKFRYQVGNILSSDIFYNDTPDAWKKWAKMGLLCVEMESYALYCNAARAGKKALGIFTVSDNVATGEAMPAIDRQVGFGNMMTVALDVAASM